MSKFKYTVLRWLHRLPGRRIIQVPTSIAATVE